MLRVLRWLLLLLVAYVAIIGIGSAMTSRSDEKLLSRLKVPEDFEIKLFAGHKQGKRLHGARLMTLGPDGNIYLSLTKQNKIVMLPDNDANGEADDVVIIAEHGLNRPHGLAFVGDALFVANQNGIVRLERNPNKPAHAMTPIVSNLPSGGHSTKSLRVGPDKHFYLNVGSSCNVCIEDDSSRATIHRYTLEGNPAGSIKTLGRHAQSAIWATGLRNSQGFAWHPVTGEFYATNEGADNRSEFERGRVNDELPPEHLNIIEPGKSYGWPHCWGSADNQAMFEDPNFRGPAGFCATSKPPVMKFTAHTTPIGIAFLHPADVPSAYQEDAIIALHGSWNRAEPAGYKLVRVKFKDNQPQQVEDFITGWLTKEGAWGRPVDVLVGKDKAIYVSDDELGVVYRVTRKE